MKIHISCASPLLQKTLSMYLAQFLASYEECDFVISDTDEEREKPVCIVGFSEESDVIRPFYRDALFGDLARFNEHLNNLPRMDSSSFENIFDLNEIENLKKSLQTINKKSDDASSDSSELRDEIQAIVQDFTNRLYDVLKRSK